MLTRADYRSDWYKEFCKERNQIAMLFRDLGWKWHDIDALFGLRKDTLCRYHAEYILKSFKVK